MMTIYWEWVIQYIVKENILSVARNKEGAKLLVIIDWMGGKRSLDDDEAKSIDKTIAHSVHKCLKWRLCIRKFGGLRQKLELTSTQFAQPETLWRSALADWRSW